ncbi:zinc finger SWIM domain-containing protein 7 isoform X2 [Carcharodon carcharias]|uniref:zinc finger SWIM domain-containing protein 7 isoform X2 n=1 Tax=Carcharodon carcharias TaxID=13397 RepID=UPI001B7E5886|nr:zinc finger SWIM domain-containing protein 7 isoform X2 [Carcharodon carcharias]
MSSALGTLPVVAEELLKKVKQVYQELSQLTDELLLALKFVFGPAALHALELVDQLSVTLVHSPSGRSLYQEIIQFMVFKMGSSSCGLITGSWPKVKESPPRWLDLNPDAKMREMFPL